MGVFENIYTSDYEERKKKNYLDKLYTDFDFMQIYATTLINTFEWKDLPQKYPRFFMEEFLQRSGVMALFKDDDGELQIFPAFGYGELLADYTWSQYTIIAPNLKTYIRKKDEVVLCYNNCFRNSYYPMLRKFADDSSYALRAVHTGLEKANIPTIVAFDNEEEVKQFGELQWREKLLYPFKAVLKKKFENGKPERVTAFDNRENDIISLWDIFNRNDRLFYRTFGINTVDIQKQERLTETESKGNDEIVRFSLLTDMYKNRKAFCDEANEKFGLNISVALNRDTASVYEIEVDNAQKIEDQQVIITKGSNVPMGNETPKEGENDDESNNNNE